MGEEEGSDFLCVGRSCDVSGAVCVFGDGRVAEAGLVWAWVLEWVCDPTWILTLLGCSLVLFLFFVSIYVSFWICYQISNKSWLFRVWVGVKNLGESLVLGNWSPFLRTQSLDGILPCNCLSA